MFHSNQVITEQPYGTHQIYQGTLCNEEEDHEDNNVTIENPQTKDTMMSFVIRGNLRTYYQVEHINSSERRKNLLPIVFFRFRIIL